MILTNRRFEREAPIREAKSVYIFCEGVKREYQYFEYFKELDSRINVEIYKLAPHEDNSPLGLLSIAKKCILATPENPNPKYAFQENDEVWLVLDTDPDKKDSRASQIKTIKEDINNLTAWNLAQSNPCFEVWLYYHLNSETPDFKSISYCKNWKTIVDQSIKGGFDSRKHPIFIETAQNNSEKNFSVIDNKLKVGSTEVFMLSKSILPIIKLKIDKVLQSIKD